MKFVLNNVITEWKALILVWAELYIVKLKIYINVYEKNHHDLFFAILSSPIIVHLNNWHGTFKDS